MTFLSSGVMPRAVVLTDAVVMSVSLVLMSVLLHGMQPDTRGNNATDGRMGRYARTHRRTEHAEHETSTPLASPSDTNRDIGFALLA